MANTGTIDYSDVTMEIDKSALIKAILPDLIRMLATNTQLLTQLTDAVQNNLLKGARTTGTVMGRYAGGTQTGASTGINAPSGIAR